MVLSRMMGLKDFGESYNSLGITIDVEILK